LKCVGVDVGHAKCLTTSTTSAFLDASSCSARM
jgi:hypothetical protein